MLFFKALFNNKKTKIVRREVIDFTKISGLMREIKRNADKISQQDYIYLDNEIFYAQTTKINKTDMIIHLGNFNQNIEAHLYISRLGYHSTIKYKKEKETYHIVFTTITNVLIIRCKIKENNHRLPEIEHFLFLDWFKQDLFNYIFSNTF
jgi:hypothetical protein